MFYLRTVSFVGMLLVCAPAFAKIAIDQRLAPMFSAQSSATVIVQLHTGSQLEQVPGAYPRTAQYHSAILRHLQESFRESYDQLRGSLRQGSRFSITQTAIRPLWLIGGFAMNVDAETLKALSRNPNVKAISYDDMAHILPYSIDENEEPQKDAATWGLEKMGVFQARSQLPGITGKGVLAGIIDTGIDASHPDLKGKVKYFKDFVGKKAEAYDDNGHGTHVAGTIAGGGASGTEIGVAPEATLAIAKVFSAEGGARTSEILEAMQWMTDPDGNPETIEDVPHVINNSWGGGNHFSDESPMYKAVLAWTKMGIFPAFAAGNSGPGAGSVSPPGLFPISFAVGATDSEDKIASFSSRGPGRMTVGGKEIEVAKPQVSAPGVKVFSAYPGGGYKTMSGTSMATPHLTGVVVLLAQLYPEMTAENTAKLLENTADDLGEAGYDPNFGSGRVNFLKMLPDQGIHFVDTAQRLEY